MQSVDSARISLLCIAWMSSQASEGQTVTIFFFNERQVYTELHRQRSNFSVITCLCVGECWQCIILEFRRKLQVKKRKFVRSNVAKTRWNELINKHTKSARTRTTRVILIAEDNLRLHTPADDSKLTTTTKDEEQWLGKDATMAYFSISQHLED